KVAPQARRRKQETLFREEAREILLDELRLRLEKKMDQEGPSKSSNPYETAEKILAKLRL
ncbi:MAG: hypothetical protein Q7S98_06435, partial [Deltaproteobacteria bacterium]|nr:hypothetical protein [Deltaproteobacteria bacterium]